jgi:hypothetical protein
MLPPPLPPLMLPLVPLLLSHPALSLLLLREMCSNSALGRRLLQRRSRDRGASSHCKKELPVLALLMQEAMSPAIGS